MLFIFRKLRRSFFTLHQEGSMLHKSSARQATRHVQPGKVRTYFAYAAGEVVLIVVGILIALQISEWNEVREVKALDKELTAKLRAELIDVHAYNAETLEMLTLQIEALGVLIKSTDPDAVDDILNKIKDSSFVKTYTLAGFLTAPKKGVMPWILTNGKER